MHIVRFQDKTQQTQNTWMKNTRFKCLLSKYDGSRGYKMLVIIFHNRWFGGMVRQSGHRWWGADVWVDFSRERFVWKIYHGEIPETIDTDL